MVKRHFNGKSLHFMILKTGVEKRLDFEDNKTADLKVERLLFFVENGTLEAGRPFLPRRTRIYLKQRPNWSSFREFA